MDDTGHIPEDDDPIQLVDDYLWNEDLTVKRALSLIDESRRADFEATYRWFMEQSGEVGPRLYGKGQRLPGVSPDFAHAAQRGIHKPAGSPYALSLSRRMTFMTATALRSIALPGTGTLSTSHIATTGEVRPIPNGTTPLRTA